MFYETVSARYEPKLPHSLSYDRFEPASSLESRVDAVTPAEFSKSFYLFPHVGYLVTFTPGGEVSWTKMSSGDGTKQGYDANGIWYVNHAIGLYLQRVEKVGRTGVFWAGGATTEEDFGNVDEFIEINLGDQAVKADMVFPFSDFDKMQLDPSKGNHWWRAINRMSKGV